VSRSDTLPIWYAAGLRFACTQCGNCCSGAPGYVWVDTDEISKIARFLNLTEAAFNRKHVRRAGRGRSLLEKPGGDCEFLERTPDGKTRCLIHPVRPVQCRTWPFWKSNVESPEAWDATAKGCPGIGKGDKHALSVIEEALRDNGTRPL
jgi:Fe-S-cluster containining protein